MLALYLIILGLICGRFEGNNKVIKNGGYTAKICINSIKQNLRGIEDPGSPGSRNFSCSDTNNSCTQGRIYRCGWPCNINYVKSEIDDRKLNSDTINNIRGEIISNKKVDNTENNLTIKVTFDLSLLLVEEIVLIFHSDPNLTCSLIKVSENIIKCTLDISKMKVGMVNKTEVSVRYGFEKCNQTFSVGIISLKWLTFTQRLWSKYYWTLVVMILLMSGGSIVFIIIKKKNNSVMINNLLHRKQLEALEIKYVKCQKKAFLDYQTAVDSFPDLGSLTIRQILSFYHFTSRVFNVELSLDSSIYSIYKTDDFQELILDENNLLNWIEIIQKDCKLQQRSLVSALLTIVLFQHPRYFLKIMKCLLVKYITKMKDNKEERILFRRSEAIIEKLVGNWITLCMYQSLKTGVVGKRFYELYRALKCKMNQGPVDCFTNKAKYALTFDHIMLGDIDYEVLNIIADVQLNLKTMDPFSDDLVIDLSVIDVQVLSLDSITQVKEKIFDKAIMIFSQNEGIKIFDEERNLCIELTDFNDLNLHLINNTTKVLLLDFDKTSLISTFDQECVMINTMKHFNMKTGTRFLLSSVTKVEIIQPCLGLPKTKTKIHLQFIQDHRNSNIDIQKQSSSDIHSRVIYNPVVEDTNKEAYFMRLLASKQSVVAFIDAFFQSIFNCIPINGNAGCSYSSLEVEQRPLLINSLKGTPEDVTTKEIYLQPIYFLFTMFEDIASSLGITDSQTTLLWKSNSFILRFWINIIKNPNFIFSVDKIGPVDGSLTTIASVLMESCSVSPSNIVVNENLPNVKLLFLKELNVYSSWWKHFIKSTTSVNEESIILQMEEIVQTYAMKKHYYSSLASLQAISNTLHPKVCLSEK